MDYATQYRQSIESPEEFWGEKAASVAWFREPRTVLSKDENGMDRWFADGELNTAYLALDYHVESGRGEQVALYYDSPVTDTRRQFSYRELLDLVARFAGVLQQGGVTRGDRVVIYMPMVPEAVIAMLACARLGAVHSVVFGGFAAAELAMRIDDASPRVLVTASCGIEVERVIPYQALYEAALQQALHAPERCIVFQRQQALADLCEPRDIDWAAAMATAEAVACTPVASTDPLYILYTSGTTGKPKGVVRDNGGHAVAMLYSMQAIYDVHPGEVFWAASDVGWVVGHSYIVYGPLLAGAASVLYEGKPVRTPDASAFWRVVQDYRVKTLFAAPTAFRAIRKEDPAGDGLRLYDVSSLQSVFVAGERLDPPTWHWLDELLAVPVVDHWWQTETGWAICSNLMGIEPMAIKAGSATMPVPGFDVQILDEQGVPLAANCEGTVAIRLPLPPGCLPTIWGDFTRLHTAYLEEFPGYYASGDGGYKDEDGYVFIMGRTDDVINVAGHRLSTGQIEEVVAGHPAVAECAVIGVQDALKGQLPVALVLLKDNVDLDEAQLAADLQAGVRQQIGAIAGFRQVLLVSRLPKTRSGKILRKSLRQIAAGLDYTVPSTIDDPASLPEIAEIMSRHGLLGD